jgi:bifunctional non-homologous end joining protein LigD
VPAEQLQLSLPVAPAAEHPARRLPSRIVPMQPSSVDGPFDDPGYFFEPWWPGTRAIMLVERGDLRLQVSGLTDALAAFPELAELPGQLAEDGVVLDGTLLVLDDAGRPDGELLRRRLQGDGHPGRPAYVASDLLWSGGEPTVRRSFRVRREWLESILAPGDRVTVGRGYVNDGTLVAEALGALGIDGLSARQLEARYRAGAADLAWLRAPVAAVEPTERPTLALILRLPLAD